MKTTPTTTRQLPCYPARLRRVPIPDLTLRSFSEGRCVEGTVSFISRKENGNAEILLRDLILAPPAAIAAVGLPPGDTKAMLAAQTARRGGDKAVSFSVTVTLMGKFADVPVCRDDLMLVRGDKVKVKENLNCESWEDHVFAIEVAESVSTMIRVTKAVKSISLGKVPPQPKYDLALKLYYLGKTPRSGEEYALLRMKEADYKALKAPLEDDSTNDAAANNPTAVVPAAASAKHSSPAKKAKRTEHYDYTPLNQLSVGTSNVFALVLGVTFPRDAREVRTSMFLVDETTRDFGQDPIELFSFIPHDATSVDVKNFYPEVSCLGSIVRLHRVNVSEYNGKLQLRILKNSTMSVVSTDHEDLNVVHCDLFAKSTSDMEWDRVNALRDYAIEKLNAMSKQHVPPMWLANPKYTRNLTEAFNNPEVKDGMFTDLLVRVITYPSMEGLNPAGSNDVLSSSSHVVPSSQSPMAGDGFSQQGAAGFLQPTGVLSQSSNDEFPQSYTRAHFEITDGTTVAKVYLHQDYHAYYWPLVCRFVKTTTGWIKIRNCVIKKGPTENYVLAHSSNNPTSFFRVPMALCVASKHQAALVAAAAAATTTTATTSTFGGNNDGKIISIVHQASKALPFRTLADAIEKKFDFPFHVKVRIVATYPSEVQEFSKPVGSGNFAWTFAMLVEDLTGRVEIAVSPEQGNMLFEMPATDLQANKVSHEVVRLCVEEALKPDAWFECVLIPLEVPGQHVFYIMDTTFRRQLHGESSSGGGGGASS